MGNTVYFIIGTIVIVASLIALLLGRKRQNKKLIRVICISIIILTVIVVGVMGLTYDEVLLFEELPERNMSMPTVFSKYIATALEHENQNIDMSNIWCENLMLKYLHFGENEEPQWDMSGVYAYSIIGSSESELDYRIEKIDILDDNKVYKTHIKDVLTQNNSSYYSLKDLDYVFKTLEEIDYMMLLGYENDMGERENIHLNFKKKVTLSMQDFEIMRNTMQIFIQYDDIISTINDVDEEHLIELTDKEYVEMSISDGSKYTKVFVKID